MAGFKLFSLPKPRGFNYTPRYYNEQKEEMKEREIRVKKELGIKDENEVFVSSIRGQFQRARTRKVSQNKKSSIRFLMILFILLLIAYYVFYR